MLALAERRALAAGLDWCFCDTDSMALIKPDGMASEQFFKTASSVCAWFEPLNPYSVKGPLFKIEDANFDEKGRELKPLMCLAISSKRYVLFNENLSGKPTIRKASLHGLGHLLAPYQRSELDDDQDDETSRATSELLDWQRDLWLEIIRAANGPNPEQVRLDFHPDMNCAAVSRYAVTTPALHRMFADFNRGRGYAESVKPFNFLLAPQVDGMAWSPKLPPFPGTTGRSTRIKFVERPIAPYSRNPQDAAANCFDRVTGQPIAAHRLKTYRNALAQYHLRPEMKFRNGDYVDRGFTQRRHVDVVGIRYIGKEANRLEEQYFMGLQPDAQVDYGLGCDGFDELLIEFRELVGKFGQRRVATELEISRGCVGKLCKDDFEAITPRLFKAVQSGIPKLRKAKFDEAQREFSLRQMVTSEIAEIGLTACANWLGVDPSNLRKFAIGQRGLSEEQMAAMEAIFRGRVSP